MSHLARRPSRARLAVRAGLLVAVMGGACGDPDVSVMVSIPKGAGAKWVEIGAFSGGVCPPIGELAGGLPNAGMVARVAFDAASPKPMGHLPAASYGFAAVARAEDCSVLATGCAVVDVTRARDISISLASSSGGDAAKCTSGEVCLDARCVPPSGVDDPSFGQGCTMELVGAGPLPNAVAGGPQISAPAVVAAGDGFVIGYMETLSSGGSRVTLVPIDADGGALQATAPFPLKHCKSDTLAYGGDALLLSLASMTDGLVAVSHPPCTQGGLDLIGAKSDGSFGALTFATFASSDLRLSTHALAPASGAAYVVAFRENGTSKLTTTTGSTVAPPVAFGTPSDAAARVARGSGVQIVVAEGPAVAVEGGAMTGTYARVHVQSASTDPLAIGAVPFAQLPMTTTAVSAEGTRGYLVTDDTDLADDTRQDALILYSFDATDLSNPKKRQFPGVLVGTGALLALDAVAHGDRLVVVAERARSITLVVVDKVSTAPSALRELPLAEDFRVPQTFVDGPVAVAATDSRVAVAWSSRKAALTDNDVVGGYAVFACR